MRAVVADDDRLTTTVIAKALKQWGMDVSIAHDGTTAWQLVSSTPPPALAVVDWMMPGIDGIELCNRIRNDPSLAGMYILFLTGRGGPDLIAGLDAGADDYMVKPVDTEELRARIHVGLRVATLQSRLTERLSELQLARDHLARLASTDFLTNLYSRRWWFKLAEAEFSRCRRYNRPLSLLIVDLDFFKQVNDTFGHEAGDTLLQRFADMLRVECRHSDIIGRLGGEEFAVLVAETSLDASRHIASRMGAACRRISIPMPNGEVRCSCSIGISQVSPLDENIDVVLRRADVALYDAKRNGRDRWKRNDLQPDAPQLS